MNYRLAFPVDAAQLAQVEALQPFSAQWGEEGFCRELINPCAQIWCAEQDGQLVGFVSLRLAAGIAEILNVAVHPAYCRRGIGFALLSRAVSSVKANGGEEISLEVHIRNLAAISLYSKAGFSELGRREHFYKDGAAALIMGKTL